MIHRRWNLTRTGSTVNLQLLRPPMGVFILSLSMLALAALAMRRRRK